ILYAKSQGFNFIITVDCGTVDFLEIQLANKLGIDIIVCDHHEPKEILPAAYAIVNPKRHDSTYPFAELGGVAVAFKLIWGVLALLKYPKEYLTEHLDLVALGLVADIVPLISENRILAKFGLKQISKTNKVGLQSLLKVAGILKREISPYEVSFILAPRINAAGRISNAEKVVTLLTTNNRHEAEIIAQQLNQENTQRQVIENQIFEESIKIIEAQNLSKSKIIVLSCDKWHEGVIGIVASKIAERYYRPSILLAIKGDRAKGSGRSISGFNIYEALKYCKDTLIGFGGHKYACGIEIAKDKIDSFIEKIQIYADNYLNINCLQRKIYIDAVLSFSQINDRTVKLLKIFEPFGQENPPLLFATHSLEVVGYPNRVGKDHLKFRVRENKDRVLEAIAFGRSSDILNLQIGKEDHVDIVYSFNEQYFAGKTKIQLNVKDLKIK
ncbi:MAG: single-stranded-DNA-specific exonuclease RecJ, partial [candidate division WOR-3 bacterium]